MKLLIMIFTLLSACAAYGEPIDLSNPNQVIRSVAKNTFERLDVEAERLKREPAYINIVIEDEMLPYVDFKYASYKVMGRHLKKTTETQRTEFVEEFKTYLVNVYGHMLLEFEQQKIKIIDNNNYKERRIVSVAVHINDKNGKLTQLAFKLRKNKKTGEWKVFDVIAEGISMLSTKQSEINELIEKNGIDTVIEMLNTKNEEFSS